VCLELFSPDIEEQFSREEKNSKTKLIESRKLPDWKREYILSKPQTVFVKDKKKIYPNSLISFLKIYIFLLILSLLFSKDHLHSSPSDSGF